MINFLVGKNANLNQALKPFSNEIINFLDDFSNSTDNRFYGREYPDIRALSFFCRRQNMVNLQAKYNNAESIRFGVGLLFHVTPSNIPTNFMYSLIFGLLSGNSNIVKLPSKKFEEIDIICSAITNILKKKIHKKIKNMIQIVRYGNEYENYTKKFSLLSDGRLIWGGDKTIEYIKKMPSKVRSVDIPFSDRYSISLIEAEKFLKLSEYEILILIKNFYNDTYSVDQNACSSPHLILWKGKDKAKAKKKFWTNLNTFVLKNYQPPFISSVDNYCRLATELIKNDNILKFDHYNRSLYVVKIKKLYPNFFLEKTKWGFFYECDIRNLNDISFVTNKSLQTLTYFGFSKKYLKNVFLKNNFGGIDRVVPIGQALNINLIWDGFDIIKILSREIEVR